MHRKVFWRSTERIFRFQSGVPLSMQSLEQSSVRRLRAGHGVLVGDFDDYLNCGVVQWVGVICDVNTSSGQLNVNWRNSDFVLKPTPQGAVYWKKYDLFRFDVQVADRYMLDAIFADIFDVARWEECDERAQLTAAEPHSSSRSGLDSLSRSDDPRPTETRSSVSPTSGFVYLIWSRYGYKIGKAVNVKSRTRLFEVKLPFPIKVEHYARFDDYSHAERSLHRYFHDKRLEGEWFDLTPDDVSYIKSLGEPQPLDRL